MRPAFVSTYGDLATDCYPSGATTNGSNGNGGTSAPPVAMEAEGAPPADDQRVPTGAALWGSFVGSWVLLGAGCRVAKLQELRGLLTFEWLWGLFKPALRGKLWTALLSGKQTVQAPGPVQLLATCIGRFLDPLLHLLLLTTL